jgi:hypothetical protein
LYASAQARKTGRGRIFFHEKAARMFGGAEAEDDWATRVRGSAALGARYDYPVLSPRPSLDALGHPLDGSGHPFSGRRTVRIEAGHQRNCAAFHLGAYLPNDVCHSEEAIFGPSCDGDKGATGQREPRRIEAEPRSPADCDDLSAIELHDGNPFLR